MKISPAGRISLRKSARLKIQMLRFHPDLMKLNKFLISNQMTKLSGQLKEAEGAITNLMNKIAFSQTWKKIFYLLSLPPETPTDA